MKKHAASKKPTVKRARSVVRHRAKQAIAQEPPAYVAPVEGEVLGRLVRYQNLQLTFVDLGDVTWPSDRVRMQKTYELGTSQEIDLARAFSAILLEGGRWCFWAPVDQMTVKTSMGSPMVREFRMQPVTAVRPLHLKQVALGFDGMLLTRKDMDFKVAPTDTLTVTLEIRIDVPLLAPLR